MSYYSDAVNKTNSELHKLDFIDLPSYAEFLLENKLEDFSKTMLEIAKEIDIPVLKHFGKSSDKELLELSIHSSKDLLTSFSNNKISEYIDKAVQSFIEERLPLIQSEHVVVRDLISISFIRRKVFRHFFHYYSYDLNLFVRIMEEVDRYTVFVEEIIYNVLLNLKQEKINDHHYFIDRFNITSPGIIFVFDLQEMKEVYTSNKRSELLGYSEKDLKEMGSNLLAEIIHIDDVPTLLAHFQSFSNSEDGETKSVECRVKTKSGGFLWLRVYDSIFKRNEAGVPFQIIGIALDVTKEIEFSQRLIQQEQQLHEAQEIARMGSFVWDLRGGDSEFSEQLLSIFELNEKSSLSEFYEYVHPTDRKKLKDAIENAIEKDGVYECEYRYNKNKNEKVIWSRGLVNYENGIAAKMKGTVMDVTQRNYMIQRLQRSEELHNQAQSLTHLGNWSWNINDNKVTWSDEMYRIYGLLPQSEEINLDKFTSMIHPDDREQRLLEIQEAVDTLVARDYVMRIVNPDGNIKTLEGKGEILVDEHNKPYKLIGTCQDITQKIRLHEQLKESEETFRQLINNAPEAIIVIDEQSKILLWNPKAVEIFGWSKEEVFSKPLMETIIPSYLKEINLATLTNLFANGMSKSMNNAIELTALNKKGKEFYISLSISQTYQKSKPIFITFIRDISKEKTVDLELEEQRKQITKKNLELERSNNELSSFNYIASHDLQEPLRKIRTYISRILEKNLTVLPDESKEYFQRIVVSATHMQRLIDDLLAFSRTSSTEKVFELTDLGVLLEEVKLTLRHDIEEKKIKINASKLPIIKVIPFQFHQLLENILSNSIKYSKSDISTQIEIRSAIIEGATILNEGASSNKSYYKISVIDNGIGFEQQYADKIFELFQRLHGKNEYSGTGIGLAICKKIMDNHEGFITAESQPGQGSTFNIYLPYETKKKKL